MPKSQVHQRGAAKAEMNMTPLIDVTFQLIVFFLLVSNIASEQVIEMVVPDLEEPKTYELGEGERIIVNVAQVKIEDRRKKDPHLNVDGFRGRLAIGGLKLGPDDLDILTNELKSEADRLKKAKPDQEVEVLLRADSALYYEEVQPVMAAITQAGIGKIKLVAYLPGKGPLPD